MAMKRAAKRRRRILLFVFPLVLIYMAVAGFMYTERSLRPTLLTIAEARAKVIATQAVNEAINALIGPNMKYDAFVTVREDKDGNVTWAQINTVEINRITNRITMAVQEQFQLFKSETIRIPFGQVYGSPILANLGPRIRVEITPIGTVQTSVIDTFEEAGINQTRHKIYCMVHSDVRIVLPFITQTVEVESQVPLADMIYLGRVPNTYLSAPLPWSNR